MSATITVDAEQQDDGQRRQVEPNVAVVDTTPGPSDADAIREAREALDRSNSQLTASQQREASARSEAARARDEAARVSQGRAADQRAVLAQTVETADAELARARIALKSAGEAGDFDAMGSAQEAIASATYRKTHASGQLAALGEPGDQSQQRQQPAPQQNGGATPGPRSRQWLTDHPRMDTDREYNATAVMAHSQAVNRGFAPETDQYFDHINRVMDAAYGHGNGGSNGGQREMPGNEGRGSGGHSGPSNRGGGGSQSGAFKAVKTGLGTLEVSDTAAGGMRIRRPQGSTLENMEEGAKICYPSEWSKDPAAALATYMGEQIKIAREIEGGGNASLIIGEGNTYR